MKSEKPAVRVVLLLAIMALAVIANHDSFRSYFENDDFGTLNWARSIPFHQYVTDLPCLAYPCQHGRPAGFMLYGALYPVAHLNYTPWALVMLAIGLVNIAAAGVCSPRWNSTRSPPRSVAWCSSPRAPCSTAGGNQCSFMTSSPPRSRS